MEDDSKDPRNSDEVFTESDREKDGIAVRVQA